MAGKIAHFPMVRDLDGFDFAAQPSTRCAAGPRARRLPLGGAWLEGMKRPRRPRDPNQLAKAILDIATGEVADSEALPDPTKNPHAVALSAVRRVDAHGLIALSPSKRS